MISRCVLIVNIKIMERRWEYVRDVLKCCQNCGGCSADYAVGYGFEGEEEREIRGGSSGKRE